MALALSAAGLHARECWRSARRRSVGLIAISLFLAALAVFFMVPRLSTYSAFEARDNAAPSFSLVADDHTMSSSEFHGRVAVLAFWTSWCLPCAKELPELQRVYKRFQNDPRVVFLAVDTGWGGETAEAGRRCLAGRHLALPMAFDSGPAAQVLGVDALPGLVLIDPDSRVRFVHYGYDVSENLEMVLTGKIEGLLNEARR
jgi:thiol-disulfide isomerase/thioredoxin